MPHLERRLWPARCGRRWIKLQVCSATRLHDSLRKIPSIGFDFFERDRTFNVDPPWKRRCTSATLALLQSRRFIVRFYRFYGKFSYLHRPRGDKSVFSRACDILYNPRRCKVSVTQFRRYFPGRYKNSVHRIKDVPRGLCFLTRERTRAHDISMRIITMTHTQ